MAGRDCDGEQPGGQVANAAVAEPRRRIAAAWIVAVGAEVGLVCYGPQDVAKLRIRFAPVTVCTGAFVA